MSELLQPSLHRQHVAVAAPSQVWLGPDGRLTPEPAGLTGVFHADTRFLHRVQVTVDGAEPQPVGVSSAGGVLTVEGLARNIPGPTLDPAVRVVQTWTVMPGAVRHRIELSTALPDLDCTLAVHLGADFAPMAAVRVGGTAVPVEPSHDAGRLVWAADGKSAVVTPETPGARVATAIDVESDDTDGFPSGHPSLVWSATVRRGVPYAAEWSVALEDAGAVVRAAPPADGAETAGTGPAARLEAASLRQLAGLRLATTREPDAPFLAAGAPWYFTLFGRDSLWAARLLLPRDSALGAGTLRALAAYQGSERDVESAEEPGKIPHEIRARELVVSHGPGGDQLRLPPVYYGTVDATALWLCLLGELWATGRAPEAVRALVPAARRAADWLLASATGPGGFLAYRDESGHGLSNQGWKDSADAMQFMDGRHAQGPIALAEVQGYAHQAAVAAADLFDELPGGGGSGLRTAAAELREFASALRARFRESFWVDDAVGPFPAMALDGGGTPLDAPGSNMGHLLGTGLLDAEEAQLVVDRLLEPELFSGYGIRTLTTAAAGYWPLSYHCGSVWAHDTAIAIRGMRAEGFNPEAAKVARGLLRASESFGGSLPELFSGVGTDSSDRALAYPAACHPQAWSAASAVVVAQALAP
ncbi:amylo-alpha-1,6-glucosidase [Sinomonas cellulolyticus]|uniref:Amylo-alpha-1,6-glucosidase n=1 Tax=Sinomonas cellulolyticus TaxID=2801916 RepID=A0ABS1K305_9MICC|nr:MULTISPECIES: glycogen debranching N-terminal domain-containing protein [Sinomonas]MBL0705924.1 amylo-alpha-1,6-glucosidase [Sinomonas cellulolyticus]GHG42649.1 amylo-alpha-1,6-glucosidase [Sinomonas sp. KCTC 49339]